MNLITEAIPKKVNKGQWYKGMPAPGQKPASGVQDPSPRMKLLVEKHGVATILKAAQDEKELNKFSTYDAMLIMGLANSLKGNEQALENRLNRMFGKVPDKQINLNLNIEASPEQLTQRGNALLANLGAIDDDLTEG